ncbi:unnamed protein product [Rangifer tarandus platyrhynchus]|uniref:Uncharacterized protein n=1 Tax=Rangifer tarandus platyrhynchus TaxID=3082113 RepID=A0ABN8ZAF4_RANTA|nr:unnamed protein product [Rangifer tarandus platyrhynchus]CAI9688444.1 unnamed protein product [Rangifer tarandus platyrhynchus]
MQTLGIKAAAPPTKGLPGGVVVVGRGGGGRVFLRLRAASLRSAPEARSDDPPNRRRPIKCRVLTSAFSSAVVAAILGAT